MAGRTRNIFKLLFSFMLVTFCACAFGQNDWVKKEIGNKVFVSFPNSPTFKFTNKAGTYTSKTENCIFIAIAQQDPFPNYADFVKLPADNQKKLIELFLDNAIKGMLIQSANEGTPYKNIIIGKYSGREASFSAINPVTGNRTTKCVRLFYALNVVYAFQSFATQDGKSCTDEKNTFLNSITAN